MLKQTSRLLVPLLIAVLALPAGAAPTQKGFSGNDAAPPETVVVTGQRPNPKKLDDIVWGFVYAHTKLSAKTGQVARWADPICPNVQNLPPGFNEFITKRILAIAQSVGARTKPDCGRPNVEIIFTAQPQMLLNSVAQNDPTLLGYHFVHDTKKAARVTRPIQAWYVTATSNGTDTYIDNPYLPSPAGASASRLALGLRSEFDHILIVANTDVLSGHAIGPVADYIAMLALAQTGAEDDCRAAPSILDLLSEDCPDADKPQSLTVADKAYLDGLYAADPVVTGTLQRSVIAEHMIRTFRER